MNQTNENHETNADAKLLLGDVLTDEHIEVVARKKALQYSYANEFQYEMFVKAIIEGAKFARKMLSKNIA